MQDKYVTFSSTHGAPAAVLVDATGEPVGSSSTGGLRVAGNTPHVTATYVRVDTALVGNYAIGDIIANSTTAALVVPIQFPVGVGASGRIVGCRCTVAAASGTIVLPQFDLILFRPATNIPFAAGSYPADNSLLTLTAAANAERVCKFAFNSLLWENATGGVTASGDHVWQEAGVASGQGFAPFNLDALPGASLLGVMRSQIAWATGTVTQTFNFTLEVELD